MLPFPAELQLGPASGLASHRACEEGRCVWGSDVAVGEAPGHPHGRQIPAIPTRKDRPAEGKAS
jgi:hypothetical protein